MKGNTAKFAFVRVCARIFEGGLKIYDLRYTIYESVVDGRFGPGFALGIGG